MGLGPAEMAHDGQPRCVAVELALAAVLWGGLFVQIIMLVVGRSVGAALFLSHFDGLGLAVVYMLVGLAVAASVIAVERWFQGQSTVLLSITTLAVIFAGSSTLAYCLPLLSVERGNPVFGGIYLAIESLAFLVTVHFWASTNSAFSIGQARRYYSFIGTGGICGSIVGGIWVRSLAADSVEHAMVIIAGLAPIAMLLTLAFAGLSHWHRRYTRKYEDRWNLAPPEPQPEPSNFKIVSPDDEPETDDQVGGEPPRSLGISFGLVALTAVFATTLIDFYYKIYADLSFDGNLQKLTSFFGEFYLFVGVTTLLTQLFVTSPILRKRSAFWGLFVSPVGLFMMTILNVFLPGLWPVTAFKLTDSVLAHSVQRSCQELLYTPLPTLWVRKLKSTSEGLWGRGSLLLAGAFLVTLALLAGTDQGRWLLASIVVVLGGWVLAIERLRRQYESIAQEQRRTLAKQTVHWSDLQDDSSRKIA